MAESTIAISEGAAGKYLHTWSRAVGSTTREDQSVVAGEQFLATYTAAATVRANTANSHLMILQGDGTNYIRVRRLTIRQANIATASTLDIRLFRTTTAGSGGTTVNARPFDAADTDPYAGVVQTLPTSKGSEGNQLLFFRLGLGASNPLTHDNEVGWEEKPWSKPIIAGNAAANGLAIKNIGSSATELDIEVEYTVSSYL